MDPVTAVSLIVALLAAAPKVSQEISDLVNQFKASAPDLTVEQLAAIDAALAVDRSEVARIYAFNGID